MPGCSQQGRLPYKVYVTNRDSGTVTVIEPRAGFPSRTVKVGSKPTYVGASPDGRMVLVSNTADGTVSFISTENDSMIGVLEVGGVVKGVEVTPDNRHALVADEGNAQVVVIDLESMLVVKRIEVGAEPHNFAFDQEKGQAYVTCAGTGMVDIIGLETMEKTGSIPAGSQPHNLVVHDGLLAVTSRNLPFVYIVARDGVRDSVEVSTGHHGIALWRAEGLAYVTGIGSDRVTVVDLAGARTLRSVEVGQGPHGIGVSPDGFFYFVASGQDDAVRVISRPHNMGHNAVKSTGFPFWVAVAELGPASARRPAD